MNALQHEASARYIHQHMRTPDNRCSRHTGLPGIYPHGDTAELLTCKPRTAQQVDPCARLDLQAMGALARLRVGARHASTRSCNNTADAAQTRRKRKATRLTWRSSSSISFSSDKEVSVSRSNAFTNASSTSESTELKRPSK